MFSVRSQDFIEVDQPLKKSVIYFLQSNSTLCKPNFTFYKQNSIRIAR